MAQDPLHLLCIEPTFPGRLGAVADWLVRRRGYRCKFFCRTVSPDPFWPEAVGKGLDVVSFNVGGVATEPSVAWTRVLERGLCYAYGCWEVLEMRRPRPIDLVLGRSAGLGSTLFVPVYLPGVPIVNFFDYYFHAHAHDLTADDPAMPVEYYHWRRAANAMTLVELENGVTPWTTTAWQRDLFPPEYRSDFLVLSDGIDTRRFAVRRHGPRIVAGRTLSPEARVVTFIARTLERLRGFDRFLKLARRLLAADSSVICIVVGGSPVQRGLDVRYYNQDYAGELLRSRPALDPERFWMLGAVPPSTVAQMLAASDLHVYPSRPYPVARSLLEAMASGCVVLAADSDPVREIITHGQTGLLARADDPDDWEQQARAVLADPAAHRPLGDTAAESCRERYAHDVTLPQLAAHFDRLRQRRG